MQSITYDDLKSGTAIELIKEHESFVINDLSGRMTKAVEIIEEQIEGEGCSCRIYTYGRVAAAGGTLFGGITGLLGAASAIGMAAHNLATLNPDYEVAKHIVDNELVVTYEK
ncbi:hypothetical protein [Maridesulfovibrio ferrireducens]|uniref:hypothetical protein n=1 Tax=Maridesulfovibrio ferrireducens TaxID=246191 RepID=UPI001A318EFE|nr:hypothetical protein [Maridesulfovibrio ferrireducens]MBI9113190.1 hypothetical protein [Maridesulfovibrio ferrireducens]